MSRWIPLSLCGVLALSVAGPTALPARDQPDPAAPERVRKTVRMLDHVYKTAIVLITDKYIKDKRDYPAGRAAIKWFDAISKSGSHQVRLIDATGDPYGPTNVARDDFDKEGVKQLKAGKDYYEKLIQKGGKRYLRAITPVPVVMDKGILCHENYQGAKKGEPLAL